MPHRAVEGRPHRGAVDDLAEGLRFVDRHDRETGFDRLKRRHRKLGLVFEGGDGSLPLDEASGGNAIVFKTLDWRYDCYLGRSRSGAPACLVVDGCWQRWWDWFVLW